MAYYVRLTLLILHKLQSVLIYSVQPLCPRASVVEQSPKKNHHRDTKDPKVAQRLRMTMPGGDIVKSAAYVGVNPFTGFCKFQVIRWETVKTVIEYRPCAFSSSLRLGENDISSLFGLQRRGGEHVEIR